MQPIRGDILFAVRWCGTFFHYGVYIGNNQVIHYNTKDQGDYTWAHNSIIKTSFDDFACGDPVYIEQRDNNTSNEDTARKAEELLGSGLNQYNLATNNCEHFCSLCRYGNKFSEQIWDAGWELTFLSLKEIAYPAAKIIINSGLEYFKTAPLLNLTLKILAAVVKVFINAYEQHQVRNIIYRFNLTKVDYIRKNNAPFGYGLDEILKRCPHCGAPMPKDEILCIYCNTSLKKKLCDCPNCSAPYYEGQTKCEYCGGEINNILTK